MEPIYEYIRGVGWQPQTYPIITLACGTRVRFEERKPDVGDRYYYQVVDSDEIEIGWVTKEGRINQPKWLVYLKDVHLSWIDCMSAGDVPYYDQRNTEQHAWVTLVVIQ